MYTFLISLCGLFFSCHGLSLSSGQSSPEPSQNDELWESINQVVESIKPMAIHAERRLSLEEKPRHRNEGQNATNNSTEVVGEAAETHILFGSHHKCGTRLLESFELNFVVHTHLLKEKVSACPHFTSVGAGSVVRPCQLNLKIYKEFQALPGVKRVLHLTRDPLKLVVAGYIYHRESQDGIFSNKWSPKQLQKMSIKSGLEKFANFAISTWLKDMVAVHTAIKADGVDALTIQVEDFSASEEVFNAASEKVYRFLSGGDEPVVTKMLGSATRFKLFNRTREFVKVSKALPDMTKNAYRQISQLPRNIIDKLLDMRYKLDYNVD